MHLTHSHAAKSWPASRWLAAIVLLTAIAFFAQGFHPFAEDGGLYAAGIESLLDPSLFPHSLPFVREPLHYSLFAPFMAASIRLTHLPLEWVLLLWDWLSIMSTLLAGRAILRRCAVPDAVQLGGVALLAAWSPLPVAGTSLFLLDPYVTARSFSTPLSLFALACAMDPWRSPQQPRRLTCSAWQCLLMLLLCAAMHLLMAAYALAFVIAVRLANLKRPARPLLVLFALVLLCAAGMQLLSPSESPAVVAAAYSRYYWFLSQWQWFEILGLIAPLALLWLVTRFGPLRASNPAVRLVHAALTIAAAAITTALLFAHEDFAAHLVARVQPLRVFVEIYALLPLLLGAWLVAWISNRRQGSVRTQRSATPARAESRIAWPLPLAIAAISFATLAYAQHLTYPASPHIEWPDRANPNPWVQAFLWSRSNTTTNALFALDAKYVNRHGEDAQSFRAIAQRSAIPDFSKDGGEAAVTPSLAPAWLQGSTAQTHLDAQPDALRDQNLRALDATWVVLDTSTMTGHLCPYRNNVVKVCRLDERYALVNARP